MSIPDYQECMLPFLECVSDGNEWAMKDVTSELTERFNLSEEERQEMLPSGYTRLIVNRVGWARTYLKEAGLINPTRRGYVRISDTGKSVLAENPPKIDCKYLERFSSYIEFRDRKKRITNNDSSTEPTVETSRTPDELIVDAYDELRNALAEELLQQITELSDKFFERLVVELLVAMGYGGSADAGKAVGKSGDGGIDGVIKEDRLGLDVIVNPSQTMDHERGRTARNSILRRKYGGI